MRSIKLLTAGALLVGATSLVVPVIAAEAGKQCGGRHHAAKWAEHEGYSGREFRHFGQALALTDAQKETLKTRREADKAARDVLHTKLADARKALAAAVDAGANDTELSALAEVLGKLHAEQALAGAKAQKTFLAVLTEEQKQTLVELKNKRQERRGGHRESRESVKS